MKILSTLAIFGLITCSQTLFGQNKTFTGGKGAGDLGYIPDYPAPGAEFECNVTGIGTLKTMVFVEVLINISHSWVGDLTIELIAPDNTTLMLANQLGDDGDNYTDCHFTQTAEKNITTGLPPFNGYWIPQGPMGLGAFNNKNANGIWKLRITDNEAIVDGTLNGWSLTFNPTIGDAPPKADFTFNPIDYLVSFSDKSTGVVLTRKWHFGDSAGTTSTQKNPTHEYSKDGFYPVKLVVTNDAGKDSISKWVKVGDPGAPVADFTVDTTLIQLGDTSYFTNLTTGSAQEYKWLFGDGDSSLLQDPTHVYAAAGIYTVTLLAKNPAGLDTMVKADYITVEETQGVEKRTSAQIVLYPNPVEGPLYLQAPMPAFVRFMDMQGQQLNQKWFVQKDDFMDLSLWPAGIYAYRVETPEGVFSGKISLLP